MTKLESKVPKPQNRQTQKAQTRESLKAAALACVAKAEYADVQIADITQAAGVAKGTFYVHFATKEALFDELRAEFNTSFVAKVLTIWQRKHAGTDDLVQAIAQQFLSSWREHKTFIRAYAQRLTVGASFDEIRDGVNPEMRAFLVQAMTKALAGEGLKLREPELVVQGLLAMWMRVGLQATFASNRKDDAIAQTLTRMTLGAVRAAADPT